jgi:PAS domain S-box-containing protein
MINAGQRYRALVDSVKDYAIFILDPEGRVETWNTGAELIKGYRPTDIIGKRIDVFYTPEDLVAGLPDRLLAEAEDKGRVEDEGWRVRKNGTRFWADVVITALRDETGALTGFAKVTRDLTERRETQERQRKHDEELLHAEEAVRLRDEFLSIASHDLKTPLTTLQIELQALERKTDIQDEKAVKRVARAVRSAGRLSALVDALLDVSRITTGQLVLQPERIDLTEVLDVLIDQLQGVSTRAGCTLVLETAGPVHGTWDRLRIEQVVTNLVSNALKYGAEGRVTVSLSVDGGDAVIEVSDEGPGVPRDALERIFVRFERAAPRTHPGGLGLGLYVSREIVEAEGGTITARNLEGRGARFTVRLPLNGPAAPGPVIVP